MSQNRSPVLVWIGALATVLVLSVLFIYTYGFFVSYPYAGFLYHPGSGEVQEVYNLPDTPNLLEQGDYLLKIGDVTWQSFQTDLTRTLFDGVSAGETVPIMVNRNGQDLNIAYPFPGPTQAEIMSRINSQWFVPFIFWFAGLAAWLFLRPRNTTTRLVVAFSYLTAAWLIAGTLSLSHEMGSALVFKAVLWLSLPVYWHLHWLFPAPLKRLPAWLVAGMYVAAVGLAAAEVFQLLPRASQYVSLFLAFLGSLVLLVVHYFVQPGQRRTLKRFMGAFLIVLLPVLVLSFLGSIGIHPWFSNVAILGVPALPGFYFYTIYQNQMPVSQSRVRRFFYFYIGGVLAGVLISVLISLLPPELSLPGNISLFHIAAVFTVMLITVSAFAPFLILPALSSAPVSFSEHPYGFPYIRANRAASMVFFVLLLVSLAAIFAIAFTRQFAFPGADFFSATFVAVAVAIFALIAFSPFVRFFEQRLFGMPLAPEALMNAYAERVATRLSQAGLISLLTEEVLPTLLVRQSALLILEGERNGHPLYVAGLDQEQIPPDEAVPGLVQLSGTYLPATNRNGAIPTWVRLVFALRVSGEVMGLWLLGHRDPDDTYAPSEIAFLQTLSTQIAVALVNIRQTEILHALYAANIQEQENERKRLAREIHDHVLGTLGDLQVKLDEQSQRHFSQITGEVVERLRQVVNNLRPPMLNYGLQAGLAEYADELNDRAEVNATIEVHMQGDYDRLPEDVEQNIFRIVQQAVENALQHAQATKIKIAGEIEADCISLEVTDDGVGFGTGTGLRFSDLLDQQHFGIVGMKERAEIVGANVRVDSEEGGGTQVRIRWDSREKKA